MAIKIHLSPSGVPGPIYSFQPKVSTQKGIGLFTHFSPNGIPGPIYSFSGKISVTRTTKKIGATFWKIIGA